MAVLITCRCGKQEVVESRLLPGVCEACAAQAAKRHQKVYEDSHGTSAYEDSRRSGSQQQDGGREGGPQRADGQPLARAGGAGDAVERITQAFGIRPCGGCGMRKKAMNTINLRGPARQVFVGLAQSILNPEKVLAQNGSQENAGAKEDGAPSRNR